MSLSIPGLSTLYSIFKRDIDIKNDRLEYRKELSKELYDNCQEWSRLLVTAFSNAADRWKSEGRREAEKEIMELYSDFHQINYYSLEESSPIIQHLMKDPRFSTFAEACCEFYKSALGVKRLVYGDIKNDSGEYVHSHYAEIDEMVFLWRSEVEKMLKEVTYKWMHLQTIEKS